MTEKDIKQAYVRIREIDNTIPDEILDFMKSSAIDALSAESKWVQAEKIKVQIEILKSIDAERGQSIQQLAKELERQLKDLENGMDKC